MAIYSTVGEGQGWPCNITNFLYYLQGPIHILPHLSKCDSIGERHRRWTLCKGVHRASVEPRSVLFEPEFENPV